MSQQKILYGIIFILSLSPFQAKTEEYNSPLSFAGYIILEDVSNMHGGAQRGSVTNLATHMTATYHSNARPVWPNGLVTIGFMGITTSHKKNNFTGAMQTVSNIQASPELRLYNLMYEQKFGHTNTVRAGIMDLNDYFNVTVESAQLLNASFAIFPTLTADAAVATYPFSGFGIMTALEVGSLETQIGLFQGNPKQLDTLFHEGYMIIGEISRSIDFLMLQIGAWHYQQSNPAIGTTTSGIYGCSEAHWDGRHGQHYGAFLQLGVTLRKQTIIPYYVGTGFRIKGLFPNRSEDNLTFGLARAWITAKPSETAYEMVYTIQITKQLSILPDLQYVTHPSGIFPNAWVGIVRLQFEPFN